MGWSIAAQLREQRAKLKRAVKKLEHPQDKKIRRAKLGAALVKRQERADRRALQANGSSILKRGKV